MPHKHTSHAGSSPELLLSSTLHLMSAFALRASEGLPCARLANAVLAHLEALAGHVEIPDVIRSTCDLLGDQWAGVQIPKVPQPSQQHKPPFLIWKK